MNKMKIMIKELLEQIGVTLFMGAMAYSYIFWLIPTAWAMNDLPFWVKPVIILFTIFASAFTCIGIYNICNIHKLLKE